MDEDLRIQAPLEAGVAALLLTLLPGSLYTIVHLSVLSESKHLWSVLLLVSVPALYLSVLKVLTISILVSPMICVTPL